MFIHFNRNTYLFFCFVSVKKYVDCRKYLELKTKTKKNAKRAKKQLRIQKPQNCEIATGDDLFGVFKQVVTHMSFSEYNVPSGVMIYTFTLLLLMRKNV